MLYYKKCCIEIQGLETPCRAVDPTQSPVGKHNAWHIGVSVPDLENFQEKLKWAVVFGIHLMAT